MNNEVEVVIDSKELFDFLEEICEYYRIGSQSPLFNERDFINWVVVRAGQLYIKYLLEPESGHC